VPHIRYSIKKQFRIRTGFLGGVILSPLNEEIQRGVALLFDQTAASTQLKQFVGKMQIILQSAETKSLLFTKPWISENAAAAALRHRLRPPH
jgi:hypothetical protein